MSEYSVEISVVMPVYNSEEHLGEAIESILAQTEKNFEFILVSEFGTSDESLEIMNGYAEKDARIKIIQNTERLGIAESLNVGLRAAKGKYIARMDADDLSASRRFEIQKLYMDTYENIGICGLKHKVIGDDNWLVDYSADPRLLKCELFFMSPLRHPTLMIRHSVIEDNNLFYNGSLAGVEDYELYLRASLCTDLGNITDDALFFHRRDHNNLSFVFRERDNEIQTELLKKFYEDRLSLMFTDEEIQRLASVTFLKGYAVKDFPRELKELDNGLKTVYQAVLKSEDYDGEHFLKAIQHRWMRAAYNIKNRCGGEFAGEAANTWRKGTFYQKWMN